MDKRNASPKLVPCAEIIDGEIASKNMRAETISLVIGNWMKAWPAKTTREILSSVILSAIFDTSSFAFAKRLGDTSVASIELETSKATATSIPVCSWVEMFIPIWGRAKARMRQDKAMVKKMNFQMRQRILTSGINPFNNSISPIVRSFFLRA